MTIAILGLPWLHLGPATDAVTFTLTALRAWSFLLFNMIICDLRDLAGDRACGVRSLPVALGEKSTRMLLLALLILIETFNIAASIQAPERHRREPCRCLERREWRERIARGDGQGHRALPTRREREQRPALFTHAPLDRVAPRITRQREQEHAREHQSRAPDQRAETRPEEEPCRDEDDLRGEPEKSPRRDDEHEEDRGQRPHAAGDR